MEVELPCHPSFVGEEGLETVKEVGQVSCHHASCEVRPEPVPEKKLGVGVGHLCHHGEHEVSDLPEEPGLGKTQEEQASVDHLSCCEGHLEQELQPEGLGNLQECLDHQVVLRLVDQHLASTRDISKQFWLIMLVV